MQDKKKKILALGQKQLQQIEVAKRRKGFLRLVLDR